MLLKKEEKKQPILAYLTLPLQKQIFLKYNQI